MVVENSECGSPAEREINSIEDLMTVVLDTSKIYQATIRHRFNSSSISYISFLVKNEKKQDNSFNSEPFEGLEKAYENFRDSAVVYAAILKEYEANPQQIPETFNEDDLSEILRKNEKYLSFLSSDQVQEVAKNALYGKDEFEADLHFINDLRDGSFVLPSSEKKVRDNVIKELGTLSKLDDDTFAMAFGLVPEENSKLMKAVESFYDLVQKLPGSYGIDNSFPGVQFLLFKE